MLHLACSVYDDICDSNDYSIFDDLESFEGFDQLEDRPEDKELTEADEVLPAPSISPERFIAESYNKNNIKKEKRGRKKGQKGICSVCQQPGHYKSTCTKV